MDPYAGMTPEQAQAARLRAEVRIMETEDAADKRRAKSLDKALGVKRDKLGRKHKKKRAFRP